MIPPVPISLALAGLDTAALGIASALPRSRNHSANRGTETRELLAWARAQSLRAVQLNAATPGLRPRDLDRSARRDLAATLRRVDLQCSGLDLWIPPEHFVEPLHVDRAVASVLGAIDLAHDLATLAGSSVVTSRLSRPGGISLLLPATIAPDVLATIAERASSRSVVIADYTWPSRSAAATPPGIGIGIDPAAALSTGEDPAAHVSTLGSRLAAARLSDISRGGVGGAVRIPVGERAGRLDVLAYMVALATGGFAARGHAVIDLRGLPNQSDALRAVMEAVGAETGAQAT